MRSPFFIYLPGFVFFFFWLELEGTQQSEHFDPYTLNVERGVLQENLHKHFVIGFFFLDPSPGQKFLKRLEMLLIILPDDLVSFSDFLPKI